MSPEAQRHELPLRNVDTAAMRPVVPGVDPFREMEMLAAAANSVDYDAYRYRVRVQNCGAFVEPK
jgi:hypothetical protein